MGKLYSGSNMAQMEFCVKRQVWYKHCGMCSTDFLGTDELKESEDLFAKLFGLARTQPDGFQCACRECQKRRRKERRGVDAHNEKEMFKKQQGKCAICCIQIYLPYRFSSDPQGARVDHCHQTGRVRGLLCHACNTLLGFYEVVLERHPDFDLATVDRYVRGQ